MMLHSHSFQSRLRISISCSNPEVFQDQARIVTCRVSHKARKGAQTQTFGIRISSGGMGVFHVNGVGAKEARYVPRTQGSQTFGRHIQGFLPVILWKRGRDPTPQISALLRKRPVLLRANLVLTKDRKRPYYRHFCGKIHREASCSKAAGGP